MDRTLELEEQFRQQDTDSLDCHWRHCTLPGPGPQSNEELAERQRRRAVESQLMKTQPQPQAIRRTAVLLTFGDPMSLLGTALKAPAKF